MTLSSCRRSSLRRSDAQRNFRRARDVQDLLLGDGDLQVVQYGGAGEGVAVDVGDRGLIGALGPWPALDALADNVGENGQGDRQDGDHGQQCPRPPPVQSAPLAGCLSCAIHVHGPGRKRR